MEQHQQPLAAALGGDQGRAVGERRPGATGKQCVWFCEHLLFHRHVIRHLHAFERARLREGGELLRLVPAQAAAEDAATAPQAYRHQAIVIAGEMRSGEAHQHAAVLDPLAQRPALARDIADVGEDQHGQMLVEEALHRFVGRHRLGDADVGEGGERALEIIGSAEQRHGAVGVGAGDDADGAAAPALVEQLHRASGSLADDFQPRHVVADFDRQVDGGLRLSGTGLEGEGRLAERQALQIDCFDDAVGGLAGLGTQHFHRQRAGRIVGVGECGGRWQTTRHDREPMLAEHALEAGDELAALAGIDAVRQPDHLDIGRLFEEALYQRQRGAAVDAVGLRLEFLHLHPRGIGHLQRDVARGLR